MKRNIFLLMLMFMPLLTWAQPQGGDRPFDPVKFQKMVEESLTKAACFTPEEAKAFFPLYNEMRTKQRELGTQIHNFKKNIKGDANAYNETILKIKCLQVQSAQIEESYYKRMLKAVPAEKVFKVMKAEDDFHRRMVRGNRGPEGARGQRGTGQRQGQRPQRQL